MEEDRRLTDLGTAADIEETQLAQAKTEIQPETTTPTTQNGGAPVRQPKKRFVGRRAAAEAAAKNGTTEVTGESGAVQSTFDACYYESWASMFYMTRGVCLLTLR